MHGVFLLHDLFFTSPTAENWPKWGKKCLSGITRPTKGAFVTSRIAGQIGGVVWVLVVPGVSICPYEGPVSRLRVTKKSASKPSPAADYRDCSRYFFWGRGLPGSGFGPEPGNLIRSTLRAMAHTRFEDLKQKRLDRMTASERAEFERLADLESQRLRAVDAPPPGPSDQE